jgi:hypothetical protein
MGFVSNKFVTATKERQANKGGSDLFLNPSSTPDGGSVRFSPVGDAALDCYEWWARSAEGKPVCFRFAEEPTPAEARQRAEDEGATLVDKQGNPTKCKAALAFFCFEYESASIRLFYASQASILETLASLFSDEEVAENPGAWDFSLERNGQGLDTRYQLVLKPGKRKGAVKAEVDAAWAECEKAGYNLEALLVNGDPTKPAGGLF